MSFLSSLGKIGQNMANAAMKAIDRVANRAEFDAVVAAIVLVATADGKADQSERAAAIAAIAKHPALSSFGATDLEAKFNSYLSLIGADKELGTAQLLDQVRLLSGEARVRVIGIAQSIAEADGTVDDAEKAMLAKLRALS